MLNKIGNIKITASQIFSIVIAVLLVVAHIAIVLVGVKAYKYYSIYPEIFNDIFGIIICLFIIIDIVYIVGIKRNDLVQKIIVCVMALFLSIGGIYGAVVMNKTDEVVSKVVETGNEDKYETISGIFVTYDKKYSNITKVEDLKSISNLHIGSLIETTEDSISSLGKVKLDESGITNYEMKTYTNNTDLLFALIGGEIDVAIFSNVYKAVFRADENVDYTQYLDQMNEFGEFSKAIKVESNGSTKDLSKDPFNVLLIGWSPIIGSTTIGLADAIIVCTVNPQTYTVSMMSIARDSYVPITCYGGECDKINSGRGTSMDCFVNTVENLIGDDIDFYMEIGFAGFAILVDCVGGVDIDNPVSFELDGIYVPAGQYVADGWQALEFARERHHMPNGDFDRQQHQKEVIMQIAKKFLRHDLTFALDVFNEVADYINTNITLPQLSSIFNMLQSTKNYTGLSLFNILDMHALRITGYADWHYSDEYELPLWIYRLYQGSLDESLQHMHEVKGEYKSISQNKSFSFDVDNQYVREPFYSLNYDEVEIHETLPPFYKNLTSMTYVDALAWAKENGATLVPTFIDSSSDQYNPDLEGMIVSQSVAYGKKVSKYPICNVVVMGNGKRKVTIPDYKDWDIERAKTWCIDNNYEYSTIAKYISSTSSGTNGQVYEMIYNEDKEKVEIYYYRLCGDNSKPNEKGDGCTCQDPYKDDGTGSCKLVNTYVYEIDGSVDSSKTQTGFTKPEWSVPNGYVGEWKEDVTNHKYTFKVVKCTNHSYGENKTEVTLEPTCTAKGKKITYHICSKCNHKETVSEEDINKLEHNYETKSEVIAPTCIENGYTKNWKECSYCHDKIDLDPTNLTDKLEHSWSDWIKDEESGTWTKYCQREGCGESVTTDSNPNG